MLTTVSGVAIGSSIGHAIGGMFGGGAAPPAEQQQTNAAQTQNQGEQWNCSSAATQFTKCMDDHSGNMQICNWYLEQLVRSPWTLLAEGSFLDLGHGLTTAIESVPAGC